MSEQDGDKARETAQSTTRAWKNLQFAIDALWDARNRDDAEDFQFYQQAVRRYAAAVSEWAGRLTLKQKKESGGSSDRYPF